MARTTVKLSGSPKEQLNQLFDQCSNNNQICTHVKRNPSIIDFLKSETGLDSEPMILLYHFKENIKEVPKCICGKDRHYHCYGYRPTCKDKSCIKIVREDSKKEFCLKNYGVEFVTQLDSMKERSKSTLIDKYGVDNITKNPDVIKKRKENNLIKWGVTDPIQLKSIRGDEKERGMKLIQSSLPEGYKVLSSDQNFNYTIKCPKGHITPICKGNLGTKKKNGTEICNQCNEYIGSMVEQEVFDYISTIYFGSIARSDRKLIKPFEIDMILEDIKICVEFNGDYWHSTKIVEDQYYHVNKTNLCLLKGYKLLQIKENDWYFKKEEIKSKLKASILNESLILEEDMHILDLSWYDDRFKNTFRWELIERNLPKIIKVGSYDQWDCGEEIYKKIV